MAKKDTVHRQMMQAFVGGSEQVFEIDTDLI